MSEAASTHMEQLLARAEERIAALESRLAKLDSQSVSATSSMDEVSSRRGLFKLAGAVATGAIAQTVVSASPAAASTTGPYVGLGVAETSTATTSITASGPAVAFQATNNSAGTVDGVKGVSNGAAGAGVSGDSANGFGVFGTTSTGYAVYSNGRLGVGQFVIDGAPKTGIYALGDIVRDAVGNMFVCVLAGTDSAASWRKIAGPSTAGQLHLLPSPLRAYDSRPGYSAAVGGDGIISAANERVVTLSSGYNSSAGANQAAVPAGALAAYVSLSVTSTQGTIGWLGLFANGQTYPGTANLTWFGPGQTLSVTTLTSVDPLGKMKVYCGLNSTHFIVDVIGYTR
jgi:hypothetical protein